jgi:O-antigen/teichoic acid export membrane protein
LIATGPALIEALYDRRYMDAGWIIRLIAVGVWWQVLEVPSGSALLALGKPRWHALANGLKLAAIAAFVPAGFWLFDFTGAILGFAGAEAVRYGVYATSAHGHGLPVLRRDLAMTLWLVISCASGIFAASVAEEFQWGYSASVLVGLSTGTFTWMIPAVVLIRREFGSVLGAWRSPPHIREP